MEFIPKHYMLSNPIFWESSFIEWKYTDTILLTAYDLLRNDRLIYLLHSSSTTLKELARENGFPKETKIFADSGIFMLEWFKLMKGRTFKQDYSRIMLTTEQILEGYKLIDPDFLVAPDEIILPNEPEDSIKRKVANMKTGILKTLNNFPKKKVVGVIQGVNKEVMDEIYDFEKSQGITTFARGGLIPIKRRNVLYCNTLKYSRQLTVNHTLHAFGIVTLDQIKCYGRCANIDSFDSTIIRALTAELYWIDNKLEKHRFNDKIVNNCNCHFCKNLQGVNLKKYEYATKKILQNLYLHNIATVFNFCKRAQTFYSKEKRFSG